MQMNINDKKSSLSQEQTYIRPNAIVDNDKRSTISVRCG